MHWSEIKLLLQYLVYNCKNVKTFGCLSLTCKYGFEMTKYYTAMKRKQFCKKLKRKYSLGGVTYYILPNGKVLKSISSELNLSLADVITTTTIFDINNDTSFRVVDYHESGYLAEYNAHHMEFRYEKKSYTMYADQIYIIILDLHLECAKCKYCHLYHTFRFHTIRKSRNFQFYLSSYCGLKLNFYLTDKAFQKHKKRKDVIRSLIEYLKNL
jgi:hypothetical protein